MKSIGKHGLTSENLKQHSQTRLSPHFKNVDIFFAALLDHTILSSTKDIYLHTWSDGRF
uniref:Uncharacterized protein n=1 Tax=Arion vulgaris TaxID=1028688 RepID=A0A0B7B7H7_9EUPU